MNSTAKVYDFSAAHERRSNRMENQKTGYIPLYRSIKKKPWAKDVFLRTLWENILFDAARKPYTANYKGHAWQLDTGQLVTTSADLGLNLCDRNGEPTSRHAVERMLAVFEKEGMILVKAERRKGTLITVLNYCEYAQKMDDLPAHNSAHNSAHNKPSNDAASSSGAAHMPEHRAAHHEQEGTNKNINNKNTMPEQVQAVQESEPEIPPQTNQLDEAFETIFWIAGMRKEGKKKALSAFKTQFKEWRKVSKGTPDQFSTMLAEDIACRIGKQFGFDKLHPASYLNGKRWEDEKPEQAAKCASSTTAVYQSADSFHVDFSRF